MDTHQGDKTQPKTFLLSGGGSGGHIRPLLAVADELKQVVPESVVISVGDRGSAFSHLTESHPTIDQKYTIFAGKFRRYHGESFIQKLTDIKTIILNIRDVFYVGFGLVQSILLIKRLKPDVVFLKGGFVGVPIGLAAALQGIPIVTHDSDALPGLANRIISRWADVHATGMPAEFYPYSPTKVRHVGVLVSRDYTPVTEEKQKLFRSELNLPPSGKILLVTGGSLGSQRINRAVALIADRLLSHYADLTIVHQVGKGNLGTYQGAPNPRLQVLEFLQGMHRYSGAADVIVSRAGANNMAEFGVQGKACIVVPSPFLAGGHQLKNGEYLREKQAAVIVDEAAMQANPEVLEAAIKHLLDDTSERKKLAQTLQQTVATGAAEKLAQILIEQAQNIND